LTPADTLEVAGRQVRFTHPDRVLYPSTGTTKADVAHYLLKAAAVLVPQAAWRPATRKHWMDGVGTAARPGESYFRKDLEDSAPDWIRRVDLRHLDHTNTYPVVDGPAVLAWFAQRAALEIHVPQWRMGTDNQPDAPDRLVIDLDPGAGVDLAGVAEVAHWCREALAGRGLAALPVTSGSKGIHLYAGLKKGTTADESTRIAHEVALELESAHPQRVVSEMKRSLRGGKVLVDWSQNMPHKTTVCPYSLRGRLRPAVAAPRTWAELADPDLRQLEYPEVLERIAAGQDPIAELGWQGALSGLDD
jgi:bifunctional non-homologous end joining protein LigD